MSSTPQKHRTHERHAETVMAPRIPQPADPYEVIRKARAVLLTLPETTASPESLATYEMLVKRLVKKGDPLKAALETASPGTWCTRRAAMKTIARQEIASFLRAQDKLQRQLGSAAKENSQWQEMISALHAWSSLVSRIESSHIASKPRQTKRRGLVTLPADWREQLVERCPTWRREILVLAATGCRPAEIGHGVQLQVEGGELVATIQGAKVREGHGQPERVLRWRLDGAAPIVAMLASEVPSEGRLVVSFEGRSNTVPERALSDAIDAAAARAFKDHPHTVTAYSLRHAAASDLKASGLSPAEVSAALGHAVEHTASQYGGKPLSKSRAGSVAPSSVQGARQVRQSKPQTPWEGPGARVSPAAGGAVRPRGPRPR